MSYSTVHRARNDVITAARHYASLSHGNVRGKAYKERRAARAALLASLEVLDVLASNTTSEGHRRRIVSEPRAVQVVTDAEWAAVMERP